MRTECYNLLVEITASPIQVVNVAEYDVYFHTFDRCESIRTLELCGYAPDN